MDIKNKINDWNKKFKNNIKNSNKSEVLFLLNKELLFNGASNQRNLNSRILNPNNQIEEEKDFYIINKEIWQEIKKKYPYEKEICIDEGRYENGKYIFIINEYIYYFYFINDYDQLMEGYFRFQVPKDSTEIINNFIFDTINDFFNKFHIKINNELQNIIFENTYFLFKIKTKLNTNINNNIIINEKNNNKINNEIRWNNLFNNNNHNNNKNFPFNNPGNNINLINNNNIAHNNINHNIINNINFNNINNLNHNNIQNNQINNQNFNILNQFLLNNNINNQNLMNNNIKKNQLKKRIQSANHKRIINKNKIEIKKSFTAGLNNIGATCYMNATLQCLAHIKKLTKYLLKPEHFQTIIKNKFKCKLTEAYLTVLVNLWQNVNINNYSPYNFKQIISDMNTLFRGNQANDSKDLILFLLETMHNELNKPLINPKSAQDNNIINPHDFNQALKCFKKVFINNYNSVISNIFYGFFDSIMKCKRCKIITHNIQCYNILIFPLEEVRKFKKRHENIVSLLECFEYYQKEEIMSGQNQIYCNNCGSMSDSINRNKLIASPNILILNLNRGKGLQFNIKIEFEEYLDIKNFLYFKDSDDIPNFYEIIGIITHFGPSSNDGHFIAFCKSFVDEKWYKYNDSIVSPSSFNEAKNTGVPYVFFYSGLMK